MYDDMRDFESLSRKAFPVDLCVPVVFGIHKQTGCHAFKDTNVFVLPSNICRVVCENVEITKRAVTFDCDKLILCVDYIVCFKFFPKVGDPYCQTFQACFVKEIEFKEFFSTLKYGKHISLEEFEKAQGTCIEVKPCACFSKVFSLKKVDPCLTLIVNLVKFNVKVKLFQERDVIVTGVVGGPVVKLPKEVSNCNFISKGKGFANDKAKALSFDDRESELMPELDEYIKQAVAEFESDSSPIEEEG